MIPDGRDKITVELLRFWSPIAPLSLARNARRVAAVEILSFRDDERGCHPNTWWAEACLVLERRPKFNLLG